MSDQVSFSTLIGTRSGLELVPNRTKLLTEYNQLELVTFARSIVMTEATANRYAGVKQLRLWEVLALYCFLDPTELQLNRRGRLQQLKNVHLLLLKEHAALTNFLYKLEPVIKDVFSSKLKCIVNTKDPMQSFVFIEVFQAYALEKNLMAHKPNIVSSTAELNPYPGRQESEQRSSEQDILQLKDKLPPYIQHQLHVSKMWDQFLTGKSSKIPDGYRYFRELGYSDKTSSSMCTLCRPLKAPKGRVPKALR